MEQCGTVTGHLDAQSRNAVPSAVEYTVECVHRFVKDQRGRIRPPGFCIPRVQDNVALQRKVTVCRKAVLRAAGTIGIVVIKRSEVFTVENKGIVGRPVTALRHPRIRRGSRSFGNRSVCHRNPGRARFVHDRIAVFYVSTNPERNVPDVRRHILNRHGKQTERVRNRRGQPTSQLLRRNPCPFRLICPGQNGAIHRVALKHGVPVGGTVTHRPKSAVFRILCGNLISERSSDGIRSNRDEADMLCVLPVSGCGLHAEKYRCGKGGFLRFFTGHRDRRRCGKKQYRHQQQTYKFLHVFSSPPSDQDFHGMPGTAEIPSFSTACIPEVRMTSSASVPIRSISGEV